MSSSKLAPLSVFGLIGRAIEIYFRSPLHFLWYTLPSLGFAFIITGSTGDFVFTVVSMFLAFFFLENFLLSEGWVVHQATTFYVDNGRGSAQSTITTSSATGQALAGVRVLFVILGMAGQRSALISGAIAPLASILLSFWTTIIVVEGKPIGDAARRSVSITMQVFWKLVRLSVVFLLFSFCIGGAVGVLLALALFDLGLDETEFQQRIDEYAMPIGATINLLFIFPLTAIAFVALYFQHRAEKEGLTMETLAQELSGGTGVDEKKNDEPSDFVHIVNEQTNAHVPS